MGGRAPEGVCHVSAKPEESNSDCHHQPHPGEYFTELEDCKMFLLHFVPFQEGDSKEPSFLFTARSVKHSLQVPWHLSKGKG